MNKSAGVFGGMDATTLLLAAAITCVVSALIFIAISAVEDARRRHLRRRLADAARRAKEPNAVSLRTLTRANIRRRGGGEVDEGVAGMLYGILPSAALLRERLQGAGMKMSVNVYLVVCAVFGVLVFFFFKSYAGMSGLISVLFGLAAGIYVPHKFTSMSIGRRQNKYMALFPEAIELMVRGLKSGVPIAESMRVVGREIPDPVGTSFRSVTDSLTLGLSFSDALTSESRRLKLADFHFFEISLSIQQETGGNLAETLEGLATTLRKRKQMKLKVKALSSEARATAYILGSLPFVMFGLVDLVDPQYMGVLLSDPRGHAILGAAIAFLVVGVFVMIKMGQFEI